MKALYSNELLKNIAEAIDSGDVCFVNLDTFEMEGVMSEMLDEYPFGDQAEFVQEIIEKVDQWEHMYRIEPLESSDSFRIMEDFVNQCIPKGKFYDRLCDVLSNAKPFRNFRDIIEDSEYRQDWFDFKLEEKKKYVKTLLDMELSLE